MPPAPSKSRATSRFLGTKKCIREETSQDEFLHEVLYTNQSNRDLQLTDVNLICDGGKIPAHAALLQAMSPFLRDAIESQGDHYLHMRDIIFPGVPYKIMKYVIQLIYTGRAFFNSEAETKSALELIQTLHIKIDSESVTSVRTRERSTEHIRAIRSKAKAQVEENPIKTEDSKKPKNKKGSAVERKDSCDSDTVLSDGDSAYNSTETRRSRKKSSNKRRKISDSDSPFPTDDSDDEWKEPNYSDKKWFDREARECQFCNKEYENPSLASSCVTGHGWLRCYFCFQACEDTEKLFEHFKKRHKPAGRENCLLCPYCEQSVQFRSVSCHVISFHLSHIKSSKSKDTIKAKTDKTPSKIAARIPHKSSNSKKKSTDSSSSSSEPPVQKTQANLINGMKQPVVIIRNRRSDISIIGESSQPRAKKKRVEEVIDITSDEEEADDSEDNSVEDDDTSHPRKKGKETSSLEEPTIPDTTNVTEQTNSCTSDQVESIGRRKPWAVTIKREGLDGRIWVWKLQKLAT